MNERDADANLHLLVQRAVVFARRRFSIRRAAASFAASSVGGAVEKAAGAAARARTQRASAVP